jgi:hypothetical protein
VGLGVEDPAGGGLVGIEDLGGAALAAIGDLMGLGVQDPAGGRPGRRRGPRRRGAGGDR